MVGSSSRYAATRKNKAPDEGHNSDCIFASLANADEWTAIYYFALENEKFLRKYLELPNGIPSHDTIERVFAMVSPEYLQEFRKRWDEVMLGNMGNKIKRILGIDGKTQRGNGTETQKANHIVSAVDDKGFCLGETRVDEKSNETTAIPELLDALNIKGNIITTDAMGCQTAIAAKIVKKHADYVLALKGNQGNLYEKPSVRCRGNKAGYSWSLDGGKLSLAFRCNISGRCEPYDRKGRSIQFKHYQKDGNKHP